MHAPTFTYIHPYKHIQTRTHVHHAPIHTYTHAYRVASVVWRRCARVTNTKSTWKLVWGSKGYRGNGPEVLLMAGCKNILADDSRAIFVCLPYPIYVCVGLYPFMCVCVCVCILLYTHTHTYTDTHIYIYIGRVVEYVCVRVCVCVCVCIGREMGKGM